MKRIMFFWVLAAMACPIFADEVKPLSACQSFFVAKEWIASSIGLNDAREMRLGTGRALTFEKNKLRLNLIETSPLGSWSRSFSVEFNDQCYGTTDAGSRVYLNIQRDGKRAVLLWLDPREVRKVELTAEAP